MSKCRNMFAGSSGSLYRTNTNTNQGGSSLQGTASSKDVKANRKIKMKCNGYYKDSIFDRFGRFDRFDTSDLPYINFSIKNDSQYDASCVFVVVKDNNNIYNLNTKPISYYGKPPFLPAPKNSTFKLGTSLHDLDNTPINGVYSFKIPNISGGKMYISYNDKLSFFLIIPNNPKKWEEPKWAEPSPFNTPTIYGFIEYSLANTNDPNDPKDTYVLYANVSAVDIYGMPLYLSLNNNSSTTPQQASSGMYIPRTYVIQHAVNRLSNWKPPFIKEDFDPLSLLYGGQYNTIRILSSNLKMSANDKTLLTDDWLDLASNMKFTVECDNTNISKHIYPSTWICQIINENGIYSLDITFDEFTAQKQIDPLYIISNNGTNNGVEYKCPITDTFDSAHNYYGGESYNYDSVEIVSNDPNKTIKDKMDTYWKTQWADAPISQCFKAIAQNIQINYFPPRNKNQTITVSNNKYYNDISNNYYSKYKSDFLQTLPDTEIFDMYSRTIHECVGYSQVYTFAYDEPMFPKVLGAVSNWTQSSKMSLYLGHAKNIDDINNVTLYDEVNENLNDDDKLQPITSDFYHAPKFTDLQEKKGYFSEYYKYFKKPDPF